MRGRRTTVTTSGVGGQLACALRVRTAAPARGRRQAPPLQQTKQNERGAAMRHDRAQGT